MMGSAHISGLMACSNCQVLDAKKPNTLTFNAHIVMDTSNNEVRLCCALLQHFHPPTAPTPINKSIYYVAGKVASIPPDYNIGPGFDVSAYDFLLNADRVLTSPTLNCAASANDFQQMALLALDIPYPVERPTLEISGYVRFLFPLLTTHIHSLSAWCLQIRP